DFLLSTMRGNPETCAPPVLRISAAGGYGKSRLASEYLHRYGPLHYSGGLFWIDASGDELALERQHHAILRHLQGFHDCPDLATMRKNNVDIKDLLAGALRQLPRIPPIIVVVDNIPENNPGEPAHSIREYCPASASVTVLATSRQRSVEPGVLEMRLDTM